MASRIELDLDFADVLRNLDLERVSDFLEEVNSADNDRGNMTVAGNVSFVDAVAQESSMQHWFSNRHSCCREQGNFCRPQSSRSLFLELLCG